MTWYAQKGDRELGPMTIEALKALVASGELAASAPVRKSEEGTWSSTAQAVLASSGSTPISVVRQSVELAGPWARYFARMMDMLVGVFLISFLLGAIAPSMFQPDAFFGGQSGGQRLFLLIMPLVMVVEAGLYALFGTTPGKALVGLQLRGAQGRIPFLTYLRRNASIWWFGLGTGFPLASLITLAIAHKKAKNGEPMRWDVKLGTSVVRTSTSLWRPALAGMLFLALSAYGAWTSFQEKMARLNPTSAPVDPLQPLRSIAAEVNKLAPLMVDPETRLDGCEASAGPIFKYKYTVLSMTAGQVNTETFDGILRNQLLPTVCGNDLKPVRDLGATIIYEYADKQGAPLTSITFPPSDCAAVASGK
ncbi:MAG: RDD family protein [Myxococcales bacterium]